ncbi:hypothetical protein DFH08DRAFT_950336 [Mycena albidolilacea]|uniref:Uncharacterized protein n=1 Tax=Mycena albidolilacea TaxID=1033008 RepID=A0AAD7APT8_9AGAR|nr:hypothetical protein DFH08DRAFT_950336 [Mycena albidolilacea]
MGSIFRVSTLLALAVAANTAYTSRAAATLGLASLLVNNGAVRECGSVILDSSLSMTLSSASWDGGARCGDDVTVQCKSLITRQFLKYLFHSDGFAPLLDQGRSVVLKVAGECPICIASGIEMTEAAFTALGASERGSPTVTWFLD